MKSSTHIRIHQRGLNRGRRRAHQVHSTESHKYKDEREQIRQLHSTESHKYEDERENKQQRAHLDNNRFRQTTDFKQQTNKAADQTAIPRHMQTNQSRTDDHPGRIMRNRAKPKHVDARCYS
ncbi:hypothetical protein Tco_1427814 [Tanacetum coccineum]